MNKLLKYILVGIATISTGIACFSNADDVSSLITYLTDSTTITLPYSQPKQVLSLNAGVNDTYCIENTSASNTVVFGYNTSLNFNNDYAIRFGKDVKYVCISPYLNGTVYLYLYNPFANSNTSITYRLFKLNALLGTNLASMTSLECQTEYNLIPIENVTANYCRLNFDLISPLECPINEGTGGTTQWTAWYINNQQYPGTSMLRITIPDYIAYSTTYNQDNTIVEIEGIDADQEYIENIINNEKLTPTNEDFANMLTGITAFIPYLFIGLLFFRFVRIINKIWK